MELDTRLRQQLSGNLAKILHAINSYSLDGITDNWQVRDKKSAILKHISDEIEQLDGLEGVYKALLNRQTITALEN